MSAGQAVRVAGGITDAGVPTMPGSTAERFGLFTDAVFAISFDTLLRVTGGEAAAVGEDLAPAHETAPLALAGCSDGRSGHWPSPCRRSAWCLGWCQGHRPARAEDWRLPWPS